MDRAYGETRYTWGTTPTSYRYTGQSLEPSLNLYLMGARWYDPALARWLSADTIVPDPSDPQNLNRFAYVTGNPLRYRDPTGHAEDTGEDSGADLEFDWNDPAVGQYYYNLYTTDPNLYAIMIQCDPDNPSLLAAENYARSMNYPPVKVQIYRQYNAELHAGARDFFAENLGPPKGLVVTTQASFEYVTQRMHGFCREIGDNAVQSIRDQYGDEDLAITGRGVEDLCNFGANKLDDGMVLEKDALFVGYQLAYGTRLAVLAFIEIELTQSLLVTDWVIQYVVE